MATASDYSQRVTDYGTDPLVGSGDVPSTRTLFLTAPYLTIDGGASGNLSADRTIAAVVTGGGSFLVGSGRTVTGTAPITVNGDNAAHDLTSNLTVAAVPFSASVDGIVTHNAGGAQGKFLRDDNTWVAGTTAGVNSVTAGTGISVSAATGDITISGVVASLAQSGDIPAVGSVDSTKFLCRTNPPTWATPVGTGPAVTLQATTPGTADVGHAHISGVFIADSAIVAGSTKKSLNGIGNENFYAKMNSPSNPPVVASYYTGSIQNAGWLFRAARGTEASPTTTQNGDELARLAVDLYTGAAWGQGEFLTVYQDGSSNGSRVPYRTRIQSVGGAATAVTAYIDLNANQQIGVQTTAPKSGFEIGSSFGITAVTQTTSFTTDENKCLYLLDNTAAGLGAGVNLMTAGGRAGRIYIFVKVDSSANVVPIIPNGAELIDGVNSSVYLVQRGDFLAVISDGTNWWSIAKKQTFNYTSAADGSAVANTAAKTLALNLDGAYNGINGYWTAPMAWRTRICGLFSTTGTPTCRFQVTTYNDNVTYPWDSGVITMPNNASNYRFTLDLESMDRGTGIAHAARFTKGTLTLQTTSGVGHSTTFYEINDPTITTRDFASVPGNFYVTWGAADPANTLTAQTFVTERVQVFGL